MKNTKYLFDEQNQTPEGMVSVSQIQTFLSCKKKWAYGYIENLKPRVDRSYLTIGKLCHVGMQAAMQHKWEHENDEQYQSCDSIFAGVEAIQNEHKNYMTTTPLLSEEIPEIEQIGQDAVAVFVQAFQEFYPDQYEVVTLHKNNVPIPALELHFAVPCPGSKGLHGFIDAILKERETGCIWCVDYKFRKALAPDNEEAYNIQNAVYSYACEKMKIPVVGTLTWQHINTPAADPQILKNGSVSRAKIKTTWKHYRRFCLNHGVDPEDYQEEMESKFSDIEWYRSTKEYRNSQTIGVMWRECIIPTTQEIKKVRNAFAKGHKNNVPRSIYPWNCKMCQYCDLCQAEIRGYDAAAIKVENFVRYGR